MSSNHVLAAHHEHSRTPSLGPSDSASQQHTQPDIDKAIDALLERVEAPSIRPQYLPITVLWDYGDCLKDKSEGVIVTHANRGRPKMNLAIRRPDGTKISAQEYGNIRQSADMFCLKLIDLMKSSSSGAPTSDIRRVKAAIKMLFAAEHKQAILDLEAEHKLLRLCSAHWKADHILSQAFSRRCDADRARGRRAASSSFSPSDVSSSQPLGASMPIRQADAAPMNMAKRAFELSPGPKSPSVSHTQKCCKDGVVVSGQKTVALVGGIKREYST